MKHLKTYEQNTYPKYIIWHYENYEQYYIVEIVKIFKNDDASIKVIYDYNNKILTKNNGHVIRLTNPFVFSKENIIYQSNDLQETLDMLPFIVDINKYNL